MQKKNGFVVIETMITIVILVTALLALYSLFSNMLIEEKRRVLYDDPRYVIRANYIVELFKDKFDYASGEDPDSSQSFKVSIEKMLNTYDDDGNVVYENLRAISCDNDVFNDEYYNSKSDCKKFFHDQGIYRMYISKSDLSYIDTCQDSNSSMCFSYKSLNKQMKRYLDTVSFTPGSNGYFIIFEFNEDKDGNVCQNNNCYHEFATIKYGDTNEVINLND